MNVIVWQSYGNVDVFKADTAGDLTAIISRVQTAIALWGIDEDFDRMLGAVNRFVSTSRLDRARRELVGFVRQHCRDTDAFELFDTTQVQ